MPQRLALPRARVSRPQEILVYPTALFILIFAAMFLWVVFNEKGRRRVAGGKWRRAKRRWKSSLG